MGANKGRQKLTIENCVATLYPKLVAEFHPTKNKDITLYDMTFGSDRKIWWQCLVNPEHTWETSVKLRTTMNCGCPYCSNKKIGSTNNLWATHPEVAKQFHPTKNGVKTPFNLSSGNSSKFWWKCSAAEDHEWESTVANRIKCGIDCPFCSNKKLAKSSSLAVTHPEIAKLFHPTKNGILTANDVIVKCQIKYWWRCSVAEDHEWAASIYYVANSITGCPFCAGQKVSLDTSLLLRFPIIAKQWHATKNGKLTTSEVSPGSDKKVWWQCENGHEYISRIANRTVLNRGCPICNESKGEKKIAEVLQKLNLKFEKQVRFETCRNKFKLPFDFLVNSSKQFLIEYQGKQHYQPIIRSSKITPEKEAVANRDFENIKITDGIKRNWCKENNFDLLEIKYTDYKNIEKIIIEFLNEKTTN